MTTEQEFRKYKKKLDRISKEIAPQIVADTLNDVAGYAHEQSIENLHEDFTIRNKYLDRSMILSKSKPKKNISAMYARTGSKAKYMDLHDQGGEKKADTKKGVSTPTIYARRGDEEAVVPKVNRRAHVGPKMFIGFPKKSTSWRHILR